jgi:hypothetical protein
MLTFQHPLWGYELSYPENWSHHTLDETEAFSANPDALESSDTGIVNGQILVRAELNYPPRLIEPVWNQHIAQVAGMLGAKQVGSAPWQMSGATGIEAEIVLPKRENQRLWAGVLARGYVILKFAVTHPKEQRSQVEPLATDIISSLKFIKSLENLAFNDWGIPLPPGYEPVTPSDIIQDIVNPENWQAFDGQSGMDALQAFYLRELENVGWEFLEYVPFPSVTDLGFARMQVHKDDYSVTLGILPFGTEQVTPSSRGKLALKFIPPKEPGTNHGRSQ